MRDLLNIVNPLFETPLPTEDELASMKAIIAGKIKDLPDDAETAKALREIEDLLTHVHAGGRMGIINGELQRINDPTVTAAQKLLARYINGLDMTPQQRTELFDLWREDKLVKRNELLQKGKKTLNSIITSYDSNPVIKELVDELMSIAALGQGKGEFALSVLSKDIYKPQKGDLVIDNRKVEVKTTDGGAGRFTDQEVRPGAGFEQAARALNSYVNQHPEVTANIPKSGLSLGTACQIAPQLSDSKDFIELCKQVINLIFDNSDNAAVDRITDAIAGGLSGAALQEYAKLSFNYYMSKKDDEGVLYINLTKDPITLVWFADADDLAASGLRLHAGTVYITSIADIRLPYPQMEIVDTKGGAGASGSNGTASPQVAAKSAAATEKLATLDQPMQGLRPVSAARAKRDETPREKR